jgi:acyl transferase domain-containing protein
MLIGSVKSNIGHLESASGLASIIKVVMAFEKGLIPPNYDFQKPNPKIPLEQWKIRVDDQHSDRVHTLTGSRFHNL